MILYFWMTGKLIWKFIGQIVWESCFLKYCFFFHNPFYIKNKAQIYYLIIFIYLFDYCIGQ